MAMPNLVAFDKNNAGLQAAYGSKVDLSRAWLKDTEKAVNSLQSMALEVIPLLSCKSISACS